MNFIQNILNWLGGGGAKPKPTPVVIPPLGGDWMQRLLILHNSARPFNYSLALNSALIRAAQSYAEVMAAHPNQFSHGEAGTDVDRANKAGYNSTYVGENIAEGAVNEANAFNMWRASPGHYANIVNMNYKDVGFGVASSSDGTKYWCASFGRIW